MQPKSCKKVTTRNFAPHSMLEKSLDWLKTELDFEYEWISTDRVSTDSSCLKKLSGIWSAPGSPFISLNGALRAIQYARENNVPHLGTCAGFQHTIIELARNILGIEDAQHEEYDATSEKLFISKLTCSLIPEGYEIDYFFFCNANCNIGEDVIYQFYPAQKHVGPFYYSKYPSGGIPIAKLKKKPKTYRPFKLSDLTADCKDWWVRNEDGSFIRMFAAGIVNYAEFQFMFENFQLCKNPSGRMDTWIWEPCGVEE